MNRQRQPAFRTKPVQPYQKPLFYVRDKWHRFQRLSTKKKIVIIGSTSIITLVVISLGSYLYFVRDINDRERLMNRNNTGIIMVDRNDKVFYDYGKSTSEKFYTLDEISDHLEEALIASEDKGFYDHGGFSFKSIAGAFMGNVLNRELTKYGGSTITQQLVKNNLLTSNKNYLRKYQELSIAIAVERQYTKDEILELYLNSVYYGEGAFGIEQAARTYFDKEPIDLTLAESSILIGLLPAPSAYSPISGDFEQSKEQQERVLSQMADSDFINDEEVEDILAIELALATTDSQEQEHAHHFSEMILDELRERYGEERVARSGYRVRTTLDIGHQKYAENSVAEQIARTTSQGATNGSLVAIEPDTGEIKALVGSADWENEDFGQVNMATSPRQPGSSFKPIYYAEALEKRLITGTTIIRDEAKTYGDYEPENFDFKFRGDITARHALATSLNIPAIEVLQQLGVEEGVETAQRMGISTVNEPETYGLTLALGTAETKLLDMTSAYTAFANLGLQHTPTSILSIEDKFGKEIYANSPDISRVQSAAASYMISSILSDERARAPTFGSSLNIPNREVAVKTGSSNENKDAWTIGYTPSLVVGVWVGDNTHQPMEIGGSAAAGPIWSATLQHMLGDSRAESFPIPGEVEQIYVCTINGAYEEYFFKGFSPPERCDSPSEQPTGPTREELEAEERRKREEEKERKRLEREAREREAEEEEAEDEELPPEDDGTEEEPPTEDDGTEEEPPPETVLLPLNSTAHPITS